MTPDAGFPDPARPIPPEAHGIGRGMRPPA